MLIFLHNNYILSRYVLSAAIVIQIKFNYGGKFIYRNIRDPNAAQTRHNSRILIWIQNFK